MTHVKRSARLLASLLAVLLATSGAFAQTTNKKAAPKSKAGTAKKSAAAPAKPTIDRNQEWNLRTAFTFQGESANFDFAQDNGESRIYQGTSTVLVDYIGFEVLLADGTKLSNLTLSAPVAERKGHTDPEFGEGTYYSLSFAPSNGLKITQRLNKYKTRPFLGMRLQVENVSGAPIAVQRIAPVVVPVGAMVGFGPDTEVVQRHVLSRGGLAVFDKSRPATMTLFVSPSKKTCLAFGMLPEGRGECAADFKQEAGGWSGSAYTQFSPPLNLQPGKTIESDPVGISFGLPLVAQVDLYYSWALSRKMRPAAIGGSTAAWASVPRGSSFDDLRSVVSAWQRAGIKHALLPAGWESSPGSYEGGKGYPKSFGNAAKEMTKSGVALGATIDPLGAGGQQAAWSVAGDAGATFLNPELPGAQEYLKKNIERLLKDGCAFFVIGETAISDGALQALGTTREQAVARAVEVIMAAAGKVFVYGGAATELEPNRDAWLEAASGISTLANYSVYPAPLRMKGEAAGDLSDELAVAMRLWPGPIEVTGKPGDKAANLIAQRIRNARIQARPAQGTKVPHLWQVTAAQDANGKESLGSLIAFSGAPATPVEDILGKAGGLNVSDAETGTAHDLSAPLPAAPKLKLYNIAHKENRPTLLGTTGGTFKLRGVDKLAWDPASGVLSGTVPGTVEGDTQAMVHVPAGWKFDNGKVGKQNVKAKQNGEVLTFGVSGESPRFELHFKSN